MQKILVFLKAVKRQTFQALIAFDQLLNTIFCNGYADETMSSNAYRMEQKGRISGRILRPFIDSLFFWQDQHCLQSYISELKRHQMPRDLRD